MQKFRAPVFFLSEGFKYIKQRYG